MKTLRISDETHRRLTATLGMLMAETGKLQTYDSTITALLTQSVKMPKETIIEVENFMKENKRLGYISREEFIKEAIRFKLNTLKNKKEYIGIPREKYDKLNKAIREIGMPYYNVAEFIEDQINKAIKQCEKFREETEK